MSVEPPASSDSVPAHESGLPLSPAAASASPAGAPPASAQLATHRPSFIFLAGVTVLSLGLDLWTKYWAKTHFESFRPGARHKLVVIEDMMSLIYAKNHGGAWGLLQSAPESVRRPFFLVVSVAAIVFIVSLYRKVRPDQRALRWGLPLVLGGALGNLIDRIRYGWVVDFIDVYTKLDGHARHWPTFNVADIAICVGVVLMGIDMFTPRSGRQQRRESSGPGVVPPPATAGPMAARGSGVGTPPTTSLGGGAPLTTAPDPSVPTAGHEATAIEASSTATSEPSAPVEGS